MEKELLYYVSNYDNDIHNIHDVEHDSINYENGFVDILNSKDKDGFVVDQVVLHTFEDIAKTILKY